MASNIDSASINALYPVAGQDNDSQGFRDNFSTIKSNFTAAKSEIEALQTNTAKKNEANNFLGFDQSGANFVNTTKKLHPASGTVINSQNVNFPNGHYQEFTIGGNVTLTLTDWPADNKVGEIRVLLKNDGQSREVTWATDVGNIVKYDNDFPHKSSASADKGIVTITNDQNPMIFDFFTVDGGATVFAKYIGIFS